jgi:predicted RNase H-like HicB family nuclease
MYKQSPKKPKKTSVLVWKEGSLFMARSLEIEVVSQGKTKEESLATLKEMLELYFAQELTLSRLFSERDISLEHLELSYV